ncbi:MAG: hypothetical protein M1837_004761 [Sclerophora amabilis]|nr:MAG: hypothetical protein M1837_004761 [Sclerophora amabilis]
MPMNSVQTGGKEDSGLPHVPEAQFSFSDFLGTDWSLPLGLEEQALNDVSQPKGYNNPASTPSQANPQYPSARPFAQPAKAGNYISPYGGISNSPSADSSGIDPRLLSRSQPSPSTTFPTSTPFNAEPPPMSHSQSWFPSGKERLSRNDHVTVARTISDPSVASVAPYNDPQKSYAYLSSSRRDTPSVPRSGVTYRNNSIAFAGSHGDPNRRQGTVASDSGRIPNQANPAKKRRISSSGAHIIGNGMPLDQRSLDTRQDINAQFRVSQIPASAPPLSDTTAALQRELAEVKRQLASKGVECEALKRELDDCKSRVASSFVPDARTGTPRQPVQADDRNDAVIQRNKLLEDDLIAARKENQVLTQHIQMINRKPSIPREMQAPVRDQEVLEAQKRIAIDYRTTTAVAAAAIPNASIPTATTIGVTAANASALAPTLVVTPPTPGHTSVTASTVTSATPARDPPLTIDLTDSSDEAAAQSYKRMRSKKLLWLKQAESPKPAPSNPSQGRLAKFGRGPSKPATEAIRSRQKPKAKANSRAGSTGKITKQRGPPRWKANASAVVNAVKSGTSDQGGTPDVEGGSPLDLEAELEAALEAEVGLGPTAGSGAEPQAGVAGGELGGDWEVDAKGEAEDGPQMATPESIDQDRHAEPEAVVEEEESDSEED